MQDEIQNEGKKNSREMWLFLIFLDLVATCVFGFFIYKSFFGLPHADLQASKTAEPFLDEVLVEDIAPAQEEVVLTPKEQPVTEAAPAAQPAPKEEVKQEEPKPEVKEEVKKEEPKKEEKKVAPKPEAKKQQSIFISGNGKTRKITFKYYGSAKKVAVIGGFTMSKPVALKKSGKEWSTSVVVFPGTYKYMFVVDGKTITDPNGRSDGGKSVFTVK